MSSTPESTTDQNNNKDIVSKLQTTDTTNSDNNTPLLGDNYVELLANLEELDNELASGDDYYLNPLVNRNLSTRLDPDTSLDKMMAKILDNPSILTDTTNDFADIEKTSSSNLTSKEMLKMLGLGSGISGSSNYVGDPYVDPQGRIVKNATFLGSLIEIPQNMGMNGYQDYYEEGRLISFSITCNDPDMIPIVFIENTAGSRNIINDLSYREAVTLGRGMTLGEALSTTVIRNIGQTSRDISGQRHLIFPYVARFKNTFTGVETDYSKIKGTADDKYFVMNYEPVEYIPYRRLYIDVFNGSADGNRMIHRIEVKRLIYEDPSQSQSTVNETELTDMNRELNILKERFEFKDEKDFEELRKEVESDLEQDSIIEPVDEIASQSNYAFRRKRSNNAVKKQPVDIAKEFINFLYHKLNPSSQKKPVNNNDDQTTTVINMNNRVSNKNHDTVSYTSTNKKSKRRRKFDDSPMEVSMY